MKVKCINKYNRGYLTNGKVYEVVTKPGEMRKYSKCTPSPYGICSDNTFEVINDLGDVIFCLFKDCAHADWVVVEEEDITTLDLVKQDLKTLTGVALAMVLLFTLIMAI